MRVKAVKLSDYDIRYFRCGDGWRIGHWTEKNTASQQNRGLTLAIGRIPEGTQAPKGRLSSKQLQALADEGLPEAQPEVIARFPHWCELLNNGVPIDVPDDTECEPLQILPPSDKDRDGLYVVPADAYTPIKTFEPEKPADKPDEKSKTAKEG